MKKMRVFALAALFIAAFFGQASALEDRAWSIDRVIGSPDAPNVLIEYSSLTCGHCAVFHAKVFPKIKEEWIDTGKLKIIYRDFPLDHLALAASLISHAAGDDAAFLSYLHAFFRSQARWAGAKDPLAEMWNIARNGGMKEETFNNAIRNRALISEINQRKNEGEKLYGIEGTPTFIINGVKHTGDLSYEEFVRLMK